MELCSDNLQNIIQQKPHFFGREDSEPMKPIEYFISCQIFQEILECVQYLHESHFVHRDLNPRNILVNLIPKNKRFVKICDFGLAQHGTISTRSRTGGVGTLNYMAPEVNLAKKYSSMCDIFSIGIIGIELYNVLE